MAIKAKITHKGIEMTCYIKVTSPHISENIYRIQGANWDMNKIENPGIPEEGIEPDKWKAPPQPSEAEFMEMTIPVKKHILNFTYSISADASTEQIDMGNEAIEYDLNKNIFSQAYAFLSSKFNISGIEI